MASFSRVISRGLACWCHADALLHVDVRLHVDVEKADEATWRSAEGDGTRRAQATCDGMVSTGSTPTTASALARRSRCWTDGSISPHVRRLRVGSCSMLSSLDPWAMVLVGGSLEWSE